MNTSELLQKAVEELKVHEGNYVLSRGSDKKGLKGVPPKSLGVVDQFEAINKRECDEKL